MTRAAASTLALVLLVGLSCATWWLAEDSAGPAVLGCLAAIKVAIIGAVFLELDRAWPVWSVLAAALVIAILGGVVLLL